MKTYKVEVLITAENTEDAIEQIEDSFKEDYEHFNVLGVNGIVRYYLVLNNIVNGEYMRYNTLIDKLMDLINKGHDIKVFNADDNTDITELAIKDATKQMNVIFSNSPFKPTNFKSVRK